MSPLLIVCAAAPALAQSGDVAPLPNYAVALEVGGLTNRDASFDLFSDRNAMTSVGLKAARRLFERSELVASWQRSWQGADIYTPSATSDADFEGRNPPAHSALVTDQFTLGPRVDIMVRDILLPYATVQLSAIRATARIDDEPDVAGNPNQLRYSGLGLGIQAMAGAEIYVDLGQVGVSMYGELGYTTPTVVKLGDLGRLKPGGLVGHLGVGTRF